MAKKVFLNDRLIDIEQACIPVTDSGFLYGAGLFETMRSYNGVVFGLNDHLDRLLFSARSLSIDNTYDKKYIVDAVYQTLRVNKLKNARMRLTLTAGPINPDPEKKQSTLLVTAAKSDPYPAEYYKKGAMVALSSFRQNPANPIYGHKTLSYFPRLLALKIAHQRGAAEALWFTVDNRLAEGSISNVFIVKDSSLYTPPIETPVLAGVARKTVCDIAVSGAIKLVEKNLFISDLLGAEEVFLTNVIMKVMPVTKLEAHIVGTGKVGPVTRELTRGYDYRIKSECY